VQVELNNSNWICLQNNAINKKRMNIKNVYAGIMTSDIEKSLTWYERLFDRKSDYNPMKILHEWDFQNGGVLQIVEDKTRAGRSSITLLVDDIEKIREKLADMKIKTEQQTRSEIAMTITIFDPENNRITFAENKQGR
jgi:predicted enzyme related to lactoylglutathione lyase